MYEYLIYWVYFFPFLPTPFFLILSLSLSIQNSQIERVLDRAVRRDEKSARRLTWKWTWCPPARPSTDPRKRQTRPETVFLFSFFVVNYIVNFVRHRMNKMAKSECSKV